MKQQTLLSLNSKVLAAFICLLMTGACAMKDSGTAHEQTASGQPQYQVPAEKASQWETLRNMVRNEYDVCQEHCGNESKCLDKCSKNYETRLDREYRKIMAP